MRTINEHLLNIFEEGEMLREATIRKFRIVRSEGTRQVSREVEHYSLPAILAVGYRVRSHRGTQFRQWATARLSEYLVKGFTMDDERLRNAPGSGQPDYFDELLERIRDIRSSERRFYQKVLDPIPQQQLLAKRLDEVDVERLLHSHDLDRLAALQPDHPIRCAAAGRVFGNIAPLPRVSV